MKSLSPLALNLSTSKSLISRCLFPLLFLSASPSYSQSEVSPQTQSQTRGTVWLIIQKGWGEHAALEKIEMRDMEQCEMQGALWKASKKIEDRVSSKYQGYECIEGK